MASQMDVLDLPYNCKIRFVTPEATYEGRVKQTFPSGFLQIDSTFLPDGDHFGILRFHFKEILSYEVLEIPKKLPQPVQSIQQTKHGFDNRNSLVESDEDDFEDQVLFYEEEHLKIGDYAFKLPPNHTHLSSEFKIIDSLGEDFEKVISCLKSELAIGLSLEGEELGRNGSITWLCISTNHCTFLFDVMELGIGLFNKGIRDIIEDMNILKVIHDCRLVSDTLFHKYQTNLVNVFDTQVADKYVETQRKGPGPVDLHVNSLDSCLRTYLNIPEEYLYRSANRARYVYTLRPPQHEFMNVMIKDVIYLLSLKEKLEKCQFEQFQEVVAITARAITNMSPEELELGHSGPERLALDVTLKGFKTIKSAHCQDENSPKSKKNALLDLFQNYGKGSCVKTPVGSASISSGGSQKTHSNLSKKLEEKNLTSNDNSKILRKCSSDVNNSYGSLSKSYLDRIERLSIDKVQSSASKADTDHCEKNESSQPNTTTTSVDPWDKLKSEFSEIADPIETNLSVKSKLLPSGLGPY